MNIGLPELVLGAIMGGIIGVIIGSIRGHSGSGPFWFGFLLGPIGWVLILLMKPQPKVEPARAPLAPAAPGTPASWLPDPTGRFQQRYWDGGRWSEHVHNGTSQHVDPV